MPTRKPVAPPGFASTGQTRAMGSDEFMQRLARDPAGLIARRIGHDRGNDRIFAVKFPCGG